MLGIHMSGGTAEGWFGRGKTSAILSIVVIAALIFGIAFGIFTAVNAVGRTSVNQPNAPVAPTAPTPAVPTPAQTPPAPVPAGVIEITAEKLVRNLMANPDKYKEGTIMQVSGTILNSPPFNGTYLGPMIKTSSGARFTVSLVIDPSTFEGQRLYHRLKKLNDGDWVTVRGEFAVWAPRDTDGAMIENVSLISVTPAK